MKKCTVTVTDEVYCVFSGLAPQHLEFLVNKFALMVEGARFMPKFKLGVWDGKVKFFSPTGKIFHRLLDEVLPFLEQWGYDAELIDNRVPRILPTQRIHEEWFLNRPGAAPNIILRDYQVAAVNTALESGGGILLMCTGAGKTFTVAALCDALGQSNIRCMVIVPSVDLVEQTATTFKLCGLDVGMYGGNTKDVNHQHVISTWQSLQNNPQLLKGTSGKNSLTIENNGNNVDGKFDCIIVDECHGAKAAVIGDLLNNAGIDIPFKFGCTGTIPKSLIDQTTIKGTLGSVIYEIKAMTLMESGYLASVEIEPVELQETVLEEFPDYSSEKAFLTRSEERLDCLADLIISKAAQYGNTLVLVNSIKQGKALQALISDSVFLYGATENEVRAEWYSTFENTDNLIVFASYGIASTGISINRIHCLIAIDSGKSYTRVIQSCGRSLRIGHDKTKAHVIDVYSNLKWSKKHARERAKYYKEAQYPMAKVKKLKV